MDSQYKHRFLNETYDSLYTYGLSYDANIRAENVKNLKQSMTFQAKMPGEDINVNTKLRGNFNVSNILAAIWVFACLWIDKKTIEEIIPKIHVIPGRMEEVKSVDGFSVFIDYAHTADALENVLTTLWEMKWEWNVITVFWATWDRDESKRPVMWEVVSRLSDSVIVTQDDDYSEDTGKIIKDILPGIDRKQWENFWIIPDRLQAIRTAILMAKKDDIILLAWKWDEHALITNDGPVEWHERSIVEKILSEIEENIIVK